MRVLLVHPEDTIPQGETLSSFDLVVDLARAPKSTYELWTRQSGRRVISIYDFACSIGDLSQARQILYLHRHELVDEQGIDWWDMASYLVVDGLLEGLLLQRLAIELGSKAELFCTRRDIRAQALQLALGSKLTYLSSARLSVGQRLRHYRSVFSKLDRVQIAQVVEDKWDPQHGIRRRFGRRISSYSEPLVLLPSAYINISRTAVAYAKLLPTQEFLLVHARRSGRLSELPPNVQSVPLHPYFELNVPNALAELLARWENLRRQLASESEEMCQAERLGAMTGIRGFIARGLAVRDAWNCVFDRHNVVGCLSADDTNAYTRIPLILAGRRGLASVACHHGALDYRMAIKTQYGDTFLAKSEMERDYLENVCGLSPETITVGGPAPPHSHSARPVTGNDERPWLMFFTEPYAADRWRIEEVYRDLLPRLLDLSRTCGLRFVLKLHPFESAKEHRHLQARLLSLEHRRELDILEGSLAEESWNRIHFAITVQSTVALECTQRGIPVFLCAWLQARYGGYLHQFAKFGAGEVIDSPEEMAAIPQRLAAYQVGGSLTEKLGTTFDPVAFSALLSGRRAPQNHKQSRAL
jgi:hypothetical protein